MLQSDSTGILQRLLKYPPVEDIRVLTSMAKRYQSYILGGCVTAKPSVLPQQVAAPVPAPSPSLLPTSPERPNLVLFTSPISAKKPTPDPLVRPAPTNSQASTSSVPTTQVPSTPTAGPLAIPNTPSPQPVDARRGKFDRVLSLLQEQLTEGTLVPESMREAMELLRQLKTELRL